MGRIKKVIPFVLILIVTGLAVFPVWRNGFFPMHDDTQPTRIFVMHKALQDGQFPVRWVQDLGYGYGYPLFNFYAPLAYYIGAGFMFFGVDALVATKLVIAFGMVLAGFSFYLVFYSKWGRLAALIGATFYLLVPYHAVQLYVRGALGEYLAFAFLPFAFGILFAGTNKWRLLLGVIGICGVILSHTISGLLLFWFLTLYFLVKLVLHFLHTEPVSLVIKLQLGSVLLALGLSAFFWLPALAEAHLTQVSSLSTGSNDFHHHFVYPDQLWDSAWGFAGSAPGKLDGMSFKIGKLHVIGIVVALLFFLFKRKQVPKIISSQEALLLSGLVLSVIMMLGISAPLWEIMPYFKFIQYPWRFLMFTALFSSCLISILWTQMQPFLRHTGSRYLLGLALILVTIILYGKYFEPQYTNNKTVFEYTEPTKIRWEISKISDEYLPNDFPIPKIRDEVAHADFSESSAIIVKTQDIRSHRLHLSFSAKNAAEILFSRVSFPEWRAVLDAKKIAPKILDGKVQVVIPAGEHNLTLYLADTPVRQIGNYASLISGLFLLLLIIKSRQAHEKN